MRHGKGARNERRIFPAAVLAAMLALAVPHGADAAGSAVTVRMDTQITLSYDAEAGKFTGEGKLREFADDGYLHRIVGVSFPERFAMETPKGTEAAPEGTEAAVAGTMSAKRGFFNREAEDGSGEDAYDSVLTVAVPLTEDFLEYGAGEYRLTVPVTLALEEAYGLYRRDYSFSSCEELYGSGELYMDGSAVWLEEASGLAFEAPPGTTAVIPGDGFNIRELWLPGTVTGESGLLEDSTTRQVVIGEGMTELPDGLFRASYQLREAILPNSLRKIGSGAFGNCTRLESAQIPSGVTEIGDGAFIRCRSLAAVELPESVTKIGKEAFYACTGMERILLPASLETVGEDAFGRTDGLTVHYAGTREQWEGIELNGWEPEDIVFGAGGQAAGQAWNEKPGII
ncbi:MAG: leucine-rich repeat domain-containing protein [Lachnospiraceae bacterium]|nr:leucine-rich repeat domain-containing protein [Lachnospiraceae bacterium]